MSGKYIRHEFKNCFENSQGYKQLSIRRFEHEDAIETDLGQTGWDSGN